jgi:hypothetical protein
VDWDEVEATAKEAAITEMGFVGKIGSPQIVETQAQIIVVAIRAALEHYAINKENDMNWDEVEAAAKGAALAEMESFRRKLALRTVETEAQVIAVAIREALEHYAYLKEHE